VVVLI